MESSEAIETILPLFDQPGSKEDIEKILMEHSGLPGPRGNLTLAYRFAELFQSSETTAGQYALAVRWAGISPVDAPVNTPMEYLPFCGVVSLGSYYCYADEGKHKEIEQIIRAAMNDERWRTREAAAMALQIIGEKDCQPMLSFLQKVHDSSNFLEKRAIVAALAHPPILHHSQVVSFSLSVSDAIMKSVANTEPAERKTEGFVALSKGLQYALSVFTAFSPEDGFDLLAKYAVSNDKEIIKIIKSNLGKARIAKTHPVKVSEILSIINKGV